MTLGFSSSLTVIRVGLFIAKKHRLCQIVYLSVASAITVRPKANHFLALCLNFLTLK